MRLHVDPVRFGAVVMKDRTNIDPEATDRLKRDHDIRVEIAAGCQTFRPILKVKADVVESRWDQLIRKLPPRWGGGDRRSMLVESTAMVVAFDYQKDGRLVNRIYDIKPASKEVVFYPRTCINLNHWRQRNDLAGLWEIEANLCLIDRKLLDSQNMQEIVELLSKLQFRQLARCYWAVSLPLSDKLLPTGKIRASSGRKRSQQIGVSFDEI